MSDLHVQAVETALDAVDEMTETQGHAPNHADPPYYRSQEHYDRHGRDKDDYSTINARSREIAAIPETQGIEARFKYPEDNETDSPAARQHPLKTRKRPSPSMMPREGQIQKQDVRISTSTQNA